MELRDSTEDIRTLVKSISPQDLQRPESWPQLSDAELEILKRKDMVHYTFVEFFAGGGMARAGLGDAWGCLFANDFDEKKVSTYEANWGVGEMKRGDVASLTLADLPVTCVDLAWASFPCQDLSLAGGYRGLGRERDNAPTRSGTFWPFWRLMRGLVQADRAPRTIVLENVVGCLTSHGGRDFAAIASALSDSGYKFGAAVINASHFVPQSRPRVFVIAVRKTETLPSTLVAKGPEPEWHPAALIKAHAGMTPKAKTDWVWWVIAKPASRTLAFFDILEDAPAGVKWHTAAHTQYLLELMTPLHRQKVSRAMSPVAEPSARSTGARALMGTGRSASAPRFASMKSPDASGRPPAARRVRRFSWWRAGRFALDSCPREKPRG